jgi:hypothetical protein
MAEIKGFRHHLLYKNSGIEWLDEFYALEDWTALEARLNEALALVRDAGDVTIEEFISENSASDDEGPTLARLASESREHFESVWPTDARAGAEFGTVLRQGYQHAIRLALDLRLPIETWFLTGARDDFEIHIATGKRQITVLMLLPIVSPDSDEYYGSRRAASKSWVVRAHRPDVDGDAEPIAREGPVVVFRTSGGDQPSSSD